MKTTLLLIIPFLFLGKTYSQNFEKIKYSGDAMYITYFPSDSNTIDTRAESVKRIPSGKNITVEWDMFFKTFKMTCLTPKETYTELLLRYVKDCKEGESWDYEMLDNEGHKYLLSMKDIDKDGYVRFQDQEFYWGWYEIYGLKKIK